MHRKMNVAKLVTVFVLASVSVFREQLQSQSKQLASQQENIESNQQNRESFSF